MLGRSAAHCHAKNISSSFTRKPLIHAAVLLMGCMITAGSWAQGQESSGTGGGQSQSSSMATGPVRLTNDPSAIQNREARAQPDEAEREAAARTPYRPGEFERFVGHLAGNLPGISSEDQSIRRFGSELVTGPSKSFMADASGPVPDDYQLGAGDEIILTIWGSVEANLRLRVDRAGRIAVPRVGTITVTGVRFGELGELLKQRVNQVFRNFQMSVAMGQLRGVRVYVTGFVQRPGAYTVSSLSTLLNAVMTAGGPSAVGSFRSVQLRRGSAMVTAFDLYDFLLKGDKTADRVVQAEDVIHVGPVGVQVGLIGSVNNPAVFELKPTETVADVLRMAGGFTAVADRSRLTVERLDARNSGRIIQLTLPDQLSQRMANGDVLRAFSAVNAVLPVQRQNKRVRIDGEVGAPGEYILPPGSVLTDALRMAGGLTPAAFLYGTEFTRESARLTQQENYERALRDLETEFARAQSQKAANKEEPASQVAQASATDRLIARLRAVRPTGRVVLQIAPGESALPQLAVEDGDHLYVPPRPTTVGVFGSVFNGGSYFYAAGRQLDDYLRLAGGPTRSADINSIFVVRANGTVVSNRQSSSGWLSFGSTVNQINAEPGDTLFVPEEMNKTTFIQEAKEWTQILYQFGLGAAALKTIRQ